MEFKIPHHLEEEHEELHEELSRAKESGGETGKAAQEVAMILHPHIVKEEEFALPLIGLLASVTEGEVVPEMKKAVETANQLKNNLPGMIGEHRQIIGALVKLANTATRENKMDILLISKKLISHIQTEEEILYPAAILVGEYLKLKEKTA